MKTSDIRFKGYVLLCLSIFTSIGAAIAVIALPLSAIGADVRITLGSNAITGIEAGLLGLIFWPLLLGFLGIFAGLLGYIPFRILSKMANIEL